MHNETLSDYDMVDQKHPGFDQTKYRSKEHMERVLKGEENSDEMSYILSKGEFSKTRSDERDTY